MSAVNYLRSDGASSAHRSLDPLVFTSSDKKTNISINFKMQIIHFQIFVMFEYWWKTKQTKGKHHDHAIAINL